MHAQDDAKSIARLAARWTRVVRSFAHGSAAGRVGAADYQTLRNELVRQAQDCAARKDSSEQPLFRELGELIAPWVTLESLARAQRPLLRDVLDRAEALQAKLEGRSSTKARRRLPTLAMIVASAISVPAILLLVRDSSLSTTPGEEFFQQIWWYAVQRWIVAGANFLNRCGTAEFAVILGLGEAAVLTPLLWFSRDQG